MRLDGIHHITAITGDAARNVDFYVRVLGLRLVKKSVNQDDPTVYHLFYGDEHAQPGADLTFFEYPHAVRGEPGSGMVHRVLWRVASSEALDFWQHRLGEEGLSASRHTVGGVPTVRFADPEGLQHELTPRDDGNAPLAGEWHEVPPEHALLGFAGARAYSADPGRSDSFLRETMSFDAASTLDAAAPSDEFSYVAGGDRRSATWAYDENPARGRMGAGSVHHIAWWARDEEHERWPARLAEGGVEPTGVIDRHYFRSIYFVEPSGVLFELATQEPGFTVDEPLDQLGERLSLPPKFEPLRGRLDGILAPLPNPRVGAAT